MAFWGVDDPTLYRQNVAAYRGVKSLKTPTKRKIEDLGRRLAHAKKKTLNPDLASFDATVTAYRKGTLSFADYLSVLSDQSDHSALNVEIFVEAIEIESHIDFNRVDQERRQVLETLVQKLKEEELRNLLILSLQYQEGLISYADYYETFGDLLKENSIRLKETPAFDEYVRYVLLSDSINADALFDEAEKCEKSVYQKLIQTEEEKNLVAKEKRLHLMEGLQSFGLTSHEWALYKEGKDLLSNEIDMVPFEKFYQAADARDTALLQKSLRSSEPRDKQHHGSCGRRFSYQRDHQNVGSEKALLCCGLTQIN